VTRSVRQREFYARATAWRDRLPLAPFAACPDETARFLFSIPVFESGPAWRLHHAQADGRPANAAFFCNGNEIAETAEVHSCHAEIVWVGCAMVLDLKSM
jgi:hypothetical protein